MTSVLLRKSRSLVLNFLRRGTSLARIMKLRLLYEGVQVPWTATIGSSVFFQATDNGRIVIGSRTSIGSGSQIVAQGGEISVGEDCFIGLGCVLTCKIGLSIGNDVLVAEYVTMRDQDHRYPIGKKIRDSGFDCAPIVIGDDVWVGAKSSVLKGVCVGNGAVIAAHTLVRDDVVENTVVAGVPSRFVKERSDAAN